MISLETDRLILRDHLEEDLPFYHRWISDPEVMRYVQGFPRTLNIEESAAGFSEATRAWIDYCFSNLSIHRVVASCDAANIASERIMRKCGMKLEARFVRHRFCEGSWHDGLSYALLREERT